MIIFVLLVFLSLIQFIVFIDVILSWGQLVGIRFRPRFIASVTTPLYETVRRYIPTGFRGIDFAPIIIFIGIDLLSRALLMIDPTALSYLPR